jgi:transposase
LNGLHHSGDFFSRQRIEMAFAFSCRQVPIVLQAEANEKIDLSIWHVHDLLNVLFGLGIAGDERQFV